MGSFGLIDEYDPSLQKNTKLLWTFTNKLENRKNRRLQKQDFTLGKDAVIHKRQEIN